MRGGGGGGGGASCMVACSIGGVCMRCEPILSAMESVAAACGGGSCADCSAVGFCLALRKRCGFDLRALSSEFDTFFFGEPREKSAARSVAVSPCRRERGGAVRGQRELFA